MWLLQGAMRKEPWIKRQESKDSSALPLMSTCSRLCCFISLSPDFFIGNAKAHIPQWVAMPNVVTDRDAL